MPENNKWQWIMSKTRMNTREVAEYFDVADKQGLRHIQIQADSGHADNRKAAFPQKSN